MNERTRRVLALTATLAVATGSRARAQEVLFDFDNAPLHASLPVDVVAGGITAHLSATAQGFSIQDTSAPVVPIGFSGRFVYPNSVFPADLLVSFDRVITAFSIRYAPQELGCDDSATMRVTAKRNGVLVGTATRTAANPGTWPVDTLSCGFAQGFDSVVVHYDSRPPTCQDWGPIFLADDMRVTPATGAPFCMGDGTGLACPCANSGAPGHGCASSRFAEGGLLFANGVASVAADSVVLTATSVAGSSCVFFQGDAAAAPAIVDDGIGCVGGTVVRLGTKPIGGGAGVYPDVGDVRIAVRGGLPPAGGARHYQCFYRNAASAFCPPATSNRTNGVTILWTP